MIRRYRRIDHLEDHLHELRSAADISRRTLAQYWFTEIPPRRPGHTDRQFLAMIDEAALDIFGWSMHSPFLTLTGIPKSRLKRGGYYTDDEEEGDYDE